MLSWLDRKGSGFSYGHFQCQVPEQLTVFHTIVESVIKHNGAFFGGFLRDFFYHWQHAIESHYQLFLVLPSELETVIFEYLCPTSPLTFKDIDLWFSERSDAIAFCEWIYTWRPFTQFVCFQESMLKSLPFPRKAKAHTKESGYSIVQLFLPLFNNPFVEEKTPYDIPSAPFVKIDIMISGMLQVSNFSVNLLTLKRENEKWITQVHTAWSDKKKEPITDWQCTINDSGEKIWKRIKTFSVEEILDQIENKTMVRLLDCPNNAMKEKSYQDRGWTLLPVQWTEKEERISFRDNWNLIDSIVYSSKRKRHDMEQHEK